MATVERLHKVLARTGLGSRREVETWIAAARVSVNGAVVQPGAVVRERDTVQVDGRRFQVVAAPGGRRVIAYHKREGEVTTRDDPEGRPTVFDHLPHRARGRWISVGRLDVNSSGLLLLTDDGDLAHRLMHPSSGLLRTYAARVRGHVDETMLTRLQAGVPLEDGPARFESVTPAGGRGTNQWFHVTLREGRNREVRRLWESQGLAVSRLIRIGYGPVQLPRRLARGRWEELDAVSCAALATAAGLADGDATGLVVRPDRRPGGRRRR